MGTSDKKKLVDEKRLALGEEEYQKNRQRPQNR